MTFIRVVLESLKSGSIAALAMMPFGFAIRVSGLRVGYYGPKFAALFVEDPSTVFLFAQHMVLGWVSAFPLVLLLARMRIPASPILIGAAYGAAYYVLVNSLALPLYFGDPTPWFLGPGIILPSLLIHVVFGVCVGYLSRGVTRSGVDV